MDWKVDMRMLLIVRKLRLVGIVRGGEICLRKLKKTYIDVIPSICRERLINYPFHLPATFAKELTSGVQSGMRNESWIHDNGSNDIPGTAKLILISVFCALIGSNYEITLELRPKVRYGQEIRGRCPPSQSSQ